MIKVVSTGKWIWELFIMDPSREFTMHISLLEFLESPMVKNLARIYLTTYFLNICLQKSPFFLFTELF